MRPYRLKATFTYKSACHVMLLDGTVCAAPVRALPRAAHLSSHPRVQAHGRTRQLGTTWRDRWTSKKAIAYGNGSWITQRRRTRSMLGECHSAEFDNTYFVY